MLSALLVAAGLVLLAWFPASEALDAYRRAQTAEAVSARFEASDEDESDEGATEELLAQAQAYNALLAGASSEDFGVAAEDVWDYEDQLSADGHDTAIGYVAIPSLSLTVPIYRGTSDAALSAGAGHLESSSLPVGGASTHAVICGHSGAAGTRCFDDLEQLEEGDVFALVVLGEVLAYRVTSIETVLPEDVDSLGIVEGEDLCTLVTCTPYGVNDHRLLVHAERCEADEELLAYLGLSAEESAAASTLASGRLAPLAAACLATAVAAGVAVLQGRGRKRRKARRRIRSWSRGEPRSAAARYAAAGSSFRRDRARKAQKNGRAEHSELAGRARNAGRAGQTGWMDQAGQAGQAGQTGRAG